MKVGLCLLSGLMLATVLGPSDARRIGLGGGRRGGSSRPRTPSPPRRTDTSSSNHFLNFERGSSSGNRGNQPSAPPVPKPPQTTGRIGFEGYGGTHQGSHNLGFDRVNSQTQNKPGSNVPSAPQYPVSSHVPGTYPAGSRVPSAPPYQGNGVPNGPPPAYPGYSGNNYGGFNDHPPAYPGRPVNAPPSYSPSPANPQFGQTNSYRPGYSNGYPHQSQYPQQNYGNPHYGGTYNDPNRFGSVGQGSYPTIGGSPYSGSYSGNSYQGNAYGGTPFGGGNAGYNGNSYYSPNNFGYSSNPGYFGSQPGYSGYPSQYNNNQRKSFFGGLPIPIPIPIPIGGGGYGGLGGYSDHSYNHRLLDTFIRNRTPANTTAGNSSTSVFVLNNSTVTPCTTDYFVYDLMKVTVEACTAEHCTAIKVSTSTNVSSVVSVHSVGLTMCLEKNVTFTYFADIVKPTLSELRHENLTVCRNVSDVTTDKGNQTAKNEDVTTLQTTTGADTTTDAITTDPTTTTTPAGSATTTNGTASNLTKVCEPVDCYLMEMCLPSVEILDHCTSDDCPFRRTGYKPCLNLKMCHSPSAPVSSFASLNTSISKIDEYNKHNSVYEFANLTLISFHRPVISVNFNCSQNVTSPGCPPAPQTLCLPQNSTQPSGGEPSIPICTSPSPTNSTGS
uniref:Uncharacterized protein n=1 Tax=Graphocephala atropunctata TaxID=36148 RepID=A0A1B6L7Q2_9HEMI